MKRRVQHLLTVACLLVLPAVAQAQSSIVGLVQDTSGAVLPGVTVEASSPALIEKTKTAVTNGDGRYTITDLRPGIYTVTFQLTGFSTVRRENVELPSEFTMTLNADLRVGALEESITVTGDAPVVDVTTAVHTQVLNREAIDAIPTGRTIQGMGQLVVGINLNLPDTGGARSMQQTYMSTHGMTSANNTVLVDGMMVNGLQGDGAIQSYFNDAMNQEVSYQTSGIGADTQAGGVRLNMIPREGGNRFSGDFKAAARPGAWQGNNLTQRHIDKGLETVNEIDRIIDFTIAQGGPIKQDKLWFFASGRYFSANNVIPDTFMDDGGKGIDDQFIKSGLVRMTWQMTSKNKLSAYFDEIDKYRGHDMQALYDPETAATQWFSPAYHTTAAKITSTWTNRLLTEVGWSNNTEHYTNEYQDGIKQPRFSQAWFAGASREENDFGGRTAAADNETGQNPTRFAVQASASYVTGSHNFKTGFQMTWGDFTHWVDANGDLEQQYESECPATGPQPFGCGTAFMVPHSVVIRNTPLALYGERLNRDLGIYAQDAWTFKRLTVNAGIRWENLVAQVLPASSPAGRFVPEREFGAINDLPNWKDWAPRFSMVYDLFGNAKTALKFSLNRYNTARTTGVASPFNPFQSRTSSTTQPLPWTDLNSAGENCAFASNRAGCDDIAQGTSNIVNGVRQSCVYLTPGCEINFQSLPANFGIEPDSEYGGFPRSYNIEQGYEIQHEVLPQLSVTVSHFRGEFKDLTSEINRALDRDADWQPVSVFNPLTGEQYDIFTRNTNKPANIATDNLEFVDPNRLRTYAATNFEFRLRPGAGAQVFGGLALERQLDVDCTNPDNPNLDRFCDDREVGIPWKKNLRLSGSYPLPYGVTLSGSIQSNEGSDSTRTFQITRNTTRYPENCVAPCPAGAVVLTTAQSPAVATNTTTLIASGDIFTDRFTQVDLKVAKTFRYGRLSFQPTFEVFNLFNQDAIITYVSTQITSTSYERPNSVAQGRIIGLGGVVRW